MANKQNDAKIETLIINGYNSEDLNSGGMKSSIVNYMVFFYKLL